MNEVRWWHFWHPQSGILGGMFGGLFIWAIITLIEVLKE
jgi:hypothetical protein